MAYTVAQLEAAYATVIEAVDASAHDQLGQGESWHESTEPLTATEDGAPLSHLAFSVVVESGDVYADGEAGFSGEVTVNADLRVVFTYRIRAGAKLTDQRSASDAARDIVKAILNASTVNAVPAPENVYEPGPVVDGFMDVQTRYRIIFDLSLA